MKMRLKTGTANLVNRVRGAFLNKHQGIDGILVTVGLCIVALLLCVTMKESLGTFVETLVGDMTTKAKGILGV